MDAWWSSDPVISTGAPPVAADAAQGGDWWSGHDTVNAPSIPGPAAVEAPAPSKPLTDRLQTMWDQASPGGPLWMAKTALGGIVGSVQNANDAMSSPTTEAGAFNQNLAHDNLPIHTMQAAQFLTPGVPRGTGGVFAAPMGGMRPPLAPAAPVKDVVQAAQNIGVDIPKYLATDSMPMQRMAAGVKNVPIAGDKIVKSAQAVTEGLGGAAKSVEGGFGVGSAAVAGGDAKDALTNWITSDSKNVSKRVYGAVDSLIDNSVKTPLTNTQAAVDSTIAKRMNAFIPGRAKSNDLVLEALAQPGGLNYQGIKDLRTFVGEKVSDKLNIEGLSPKETSALYANLTKDLRANIEQSGGQPALQAWERANRIHSMVQDRKTALAKIVGVSGDAAPEAVFSRLTAMAGSKSTADISKLMLARKTVGPEAWNEVASAAVAKLGRDAQGNFSPDRYLTAFGNLSQSGKSILFGSTGKPGLLKSLEDINAVSTHIKDKIGKFANHSGTAHGLIGAGMFTAVLHEPVTLITSLIGGHAVADALSKPATARAVADFAKTYQQTVTVPSPSRAAMLQLSIRNLAATLAQSVKGLDPRSLINGLQGAVPAPANQQTPQGSVGGDNQPNPYAVGQQG